MKTLTLKLVKTGNYLEITKEGNIRTWYLVTHLTGWIRKACYVKRIGKGLYCTAK